MLFSEKQYLFGIYGDAFIREFSLDISWYARISI